MRNLPRGRPELVIASGRAIAFLDRFVFAHVFAFLGASVEARAFLVINVGGAVDPHEAVATPGRDRAGWRSRRFRGSFARRG